MQQCSDGIIYEVAVLFLHLHFEEIYQGCRMEDQLTLSQPEGADYAPHITTRPPDFQTFSY